MSTITTQFPCHGLASAPGLGVRYWVPTSVTEKQFDEHIRPYLSMAPRAVHGTVQRVFECKIPLTVQGLQLHPVSLAYRVPVGKFAD